MIFGEEDRIEWSERWRGTGLRCGERHFTLVDKLLEAVML